MASASGTFCGVCETQHTVMEATVWCSECDEGLCSSCEKHHRASKASRNHEVISVNNYQKLPHTIASINQYCPDHDKKNQHYCSLHEKLCCPLCITRSHKTCDLMAVDDIVKTSKTSALFDIMERSLIYMKSNMKKIVEDRKQNLVKIQQQRHSFQTIIKEMREKINKHLDKLENGLQQDIQAAEQKVQSQIERLLSKYSDHGKAIDEIQKNIFATKNFATDLQTFLGGKMFEAEIQSEEKCVQSLIDDGSLQQINLQCRIDDKVSTILSMSKMGEISIKANPPTITLTMNSDKQAQKMVPTISKTINDINSTLLKKIKIPNRGRRNEITGCTIMPTGEIVFVDNNTDSLIIYNENGLFDCEMPVSGLIVDATYIDENTVAVTRSEKPSYILIFNIRNKKIVKMFKTSERCYGITNNNGKLIYYETGRGILTVDVNNESSVTTVVKIDDEHDWTYVTTLKDKIYHSNYYSNTVTCYTVTGHKVWEYKDESILKENRGVTVDNDSNVYVASTKNNRIVVISPDGKHARELLGEEHKIEKPYCIHFDQKRKNLLISNLHGTAFLYNIT